MEIFDVPAISEFRKEAMWRKILIDRPDMYVSILTFEPGQELRVHKHPGCEIWIYILVGEAYVHSGDEEKVLRGGQAMHILPNTWHGILNESDSSCMVMSVQAPKAKMSNWRDFDPGVCPECGYSIGLPPEHERCPMCDLDLNLLDY